MVRREGDPQGSHRECGRSLRTSAGERAGLEGGGQSHQRGHGNTNHGTCPWERVRVRRNGSRPVWIGGPRGVRREHQDRPLRGRRKGATGAVASGRWHRDSRKWRPEQRYCFRNSEKKRPGKYIFKVIYCFSRPWASRLAFQK